MPVDILVGTQWGDEGKGKLIDVLTRDVDVVVRFQGGNNAGHTVEIGDERYVLHLVPSGVFRPEVKCVVGNGVVADPVALEEELEALDSRGVSTANVFISNRTQLIFCYHRIMDRINESGDGVKIGTTGRGIGPAYSDKMRRVGIRAIDLTAPERLAAAFRAEARKYNALFKRCGAPEIDTEAELAKVLAAAAKLAPRVRDTVYIVNAAVKAGKKVLFEGAQGALLDIDHGTYPFVTSSNTTSGGACTGGGVPPQSVRDVWGVIKAYTTRVGEGPFPTELFDACGENLRRRGREFGATTGRPRRCGWFDAVASRYACMVNGVNKLAVTKLDVLDDLEKIAVCVGYEVNGKVTDEFPASLAELEAAKPVLEYLPGWKCDTSGARSWNDLPEAARRYLERMAELVDSTVAIVSVGPRRDQTFAV
ncbi:MAG: adenylosuccinate synthase [Lentisphaeria bacterium]|nr:adenylosuccinate synthase [Lentisphaeria bacterium]